MKNAIKTHWRAVLARLPLPMLALAASYGVYQFALLFVPEWVAIVQAAAFECAYIGLAITRGLDAGQRKRATAISLGAVAASIIYNTLAGWFHAQPDILVGAGPIAWLCLALLHGAPLAWVAFLVANLLLHSETSAPAIVGVPMPALAQSSAETAAYDSIRLEATEPAAKGINAPSGECPNCGRPLDAARLGAAKRWGHCPACKGA